MLFKILLPLMVAGIVYLMGRKHGSEDTIDPPAPLSTSGNAGQLPAPTERPMNMQRRLLIQGVPALVILSTVTAIYLDWAESNEIVRVRIINTRTGAVTAYEAHRKDIHKKTIKTIDGRLITLADIERMEVDQPDPIP